MNTQLAFIKSAGGTEKIGGYGAIYTDAKNTDLQDEYFDKTTDFFIDVGEVKTAPLMFDHGMDEFTKREIFGTVTYTRDEIGIYAEADLTIKSPELFTEEVLKRRKLYIAELRKLAVKNILAWSSGAVSHAVVKGIPDGNGKRHIKQWPIGEFSLTPTPAESDSKVEINVFKHIVVSDTMNEDEKGVSKVMDSVKSLLAEIVKSKDEDAVIKSLAEINANIAEIKVSIDEMKSVEAETLTIEDDKPEIETEVSLSEYIADIK